MATTPVDDDLPEWPVEPDSPPKVIVLAEDLHLGVPVVQPFDKSWIEQHGPKPLSAGMRAMDFLILAMFSGTVILFVKACSWAFLS